MESTTCNVRDNDRDKTTRPDVAGLGPVPSDIKAQMPVLAWMLRNLADQLGRESVQQQLKASVDLRAAFDADDYRGVNAVYRRGHGWIDAEEGGFCVGVPAGVMQAFARRHRST